MKKIVIGFFFLCISSLYANNTNGYRKIQLGIDVFEASDFKSIKGSRVGLITNATGMNSHLKSTIDILFDSKNINLVALFAPEHGIRGTEKAGTHINHSIDMITQLPVYSLYGKNKSPSIEQLSKIDILIFDIQDIGCRSYTYISTMGECMKAAAKAHIPFYVLDRPNPLGGKRVEGSGVNSKFFSFVSAFDIPYIYGLTIGELAIYLNHEVDAYKECELHVIKMNNWSRNMLWKDIGLNWIPTSPHIPNSITCQYYPITGILGELYYYNIGVGYTMPFQLIGAPWIDSNEFARVMNKLELPGVKFLPVSYKPYYSTFKNIMCHGVAIHITNYELVRLTDIGFYAISVLNTLYPKHMAFNKATEKRYSMFDKVCGSNYYRIQLLKGTSWDFLQEKWQKNEKEWIRKTLKYHLYD